MTRRGYWDGLTEAMCPKEDARRNVAARHGGTECIQALWEFHARPLKRLTMSLGHPVIASRAASFSLLMSLYGAKRREYEATRKMSPLNARH